MACIDKLDAEDSEGGISGPQHGFDVGQEHAEPSREGAGLKSAGRALLHDKPCDELPVSGH